MMIRKAHVIGLVGIAHKYFYFIHLYAEFMILTNIRKNPEQQNLPSGLFEDLEVVRP